MIFSGILLCSANLMFLIVTHLTVLVVSARKALSVWRTKKMKPEKKKKTIAAVYATCELYINVWIKKKETMYIKMYFDWVGRNAAVATTYSNSLLVWRSLETFQIKLMLVNTRILLFWTIFTAFVEINVSLVLIVCLYLIHIYKFLTDYDLNFISNCCW